MVEVVNSTSTELTANQIIPFTKSTVDSNNKIAFDSTNNAIVISKVGLYEINGSFIFIPKAATSATTTIQAYANGNPIPYDLTTMSTDASTTYTFTLPSKLINVISSTSGNTVAITFEASADGTLTNAVASVKYVE